MGVVTSLTCERVRGQISLLLDAELSELERRMVTAHLERCPDCHAFEETAAAFTAELRAAPFEPFQGQVVVRRPRRLPFAATQVAAAAAVVAVAVIGAVGQLGSSSSPDPARDDRSLVRAGLFKSSWRPEWEVAQLDSSTAVTRDRAHGRDEAPVPAGAV